MLLFAAALLFAPHYEVARASETPVSLTTDAKGYSYVVSSGADDQEFLSRFDPDGKLVYHISAQAAFSAIAVDHAGDVYAVLRSQLVARIDPAGNMVTFPAPFGQGDEGAIAIAPGPDGSFYLTGNADPHGVLTTPGAWISGAQASAGGTLPLPFAMRIGPAGQLIYATYLDTLHTPPYPTNVSIIGSAIAVDAEGNAYIGGIDTDPEFPTTAGAFQTQCCAQGVGTAFLVKLNPQGTAPVYSTFLPGQAVTSVAVDSSGNASLTTNTIAVSSSNQETAYTLTSAQLSADGSSLSQVVNTSLPPTSGSWLYTATDGQGDILVTGAPAPHSFGVTEGAFHNGTGFLQIVRASDGTVLYSSLLPAGAGAGGIGPDGAGGFVVLGNGAPSSGPIYPAPPLGRPLFTLTRFVPADAPQPAILGVVNPFEYAVSEGLAPGEIISIYGANLGPAEGVSAVRQNGDLPTNLSGTQVFVNGIATPVLWAGAEQVNAVVPFEAAGTQTVTVEVRVNGVSSNPAQIPVLASEPAVIGGQGSALALNQDGTVNSQSNPAQLGTVVTLFVNGAGTQTPTPADGTLAPFGPVPALPVSVQATGPTGYFAQWQPCEVLYAGAAPEEIAGLLQVDFRLPTSPQVVNGNSSTLMVTVGNEAALSGIWVTPQ